MQVNLTDIVLDDRIYPRSGVSSINVARFVSALKTGVTFPPLVVEAGTLRLVDGWHRHSAYSQMDRATVEVVAKVYASEAELFADAVRLNIGHGQALDQYSINNAIIRLTKLGYTKEQVSEVIKLPIEKIERIERGFAVSAIDGEPIAVKGGLRHLAGQQLTAEQIATNRRYSGLKATFYIAQITELLKHDMQPRSAAFVRAMDNFCLLWEQVRNREDAA